MKKNGFTLLETIISISIIGVLGVIFANTLSQGLRGQNKTVLIGQAKQNGNLILNSLEKDIHNADEVVCVGKFNVALTCTSDATQTCGDTLVLKKGAVYSRYRFLPIGSIGSISLENTISIDIARSDKAYLCSDAPSSQISYLTNIDSLNGISITNGVFTRKYQAGFNDLVVVSFFINSANGTNQTVENSLIPGGVPFSTTIQIR